MTDYWEVNETEYAICQRRGHEPDGTGLTEGTGPTWQHCRWCRERFRFIAPVLVEWPDEHGQEQP